MLSCRGGEFIKQGLCSVAASVPSASVARRKHWWALQGCYWLPVSLVKQQRSPATAPPLVWDHDLGSSLRRVPDAAWAAGHGSLLARRAMHVLGGSPEDTIFALSTPPGRGGVCIFRISGPLASRTLASMLSRNGGNEGRLPKPRYASVRNLWHPDGSGVVLDRGMVLWFPNPASFTGEDVVELHLHGSLAVTQAFLGALKVVDGLRIAEPGEFTRRALLNGKMDLVEAEGLADLLSAGTELQRIVALRQMAGESSRIYEGWRKILVRCLAHTEAFIDFGEDEEIPEEALRGALQDAQVVEREIRAHCDDSRCGEVVREGVKIVLAGPPNVGKSSLLNALARRPAAITSARPGTTRDLLEVSLDLSGLPVVVSDTAGLRLEGSDDVEDEGIRRASRAWASADVRVLVLDAAGGAEQLHDVMKVLEREVGSIDSDREVLVLLNKLDLLNENPDRAESVSRGAKEMLGKNVQVRLGSCQTGEGVEDTVAALHDAAMRRLHGRDLGDSALITRLRHRMHLEMCAKALQRFLAVEGTPDVLAEELREAVQQIGAVTGRVHVEQVLDVLFADFCVGK